MDPRQSLHLLQTSIRTWHGLLWDRHGSFWTDTVIKSLLMGLRSPWRSKTQAQQTHSEVSKNTCTKHTALSCSLCVHAYIHVRTVHIICGPTESTLLMPTHIHFKAEQSKASHHYSVVVHILVVFCLSPQICFRSISFFIGIGVENWKRQSFGNHPARCKISEWFGWDNFIFWIHRTQGPQNLNREVLKP